MEHITGTRLFKLCELFSYNDIVAPAGFVTDGGSKPKFSWILVGHPYDECIEAYVIHDWMVKNPDKYTRKEADDTFMEIMIRLGVVPLWKIDMMWRAVSLGQKGNCDDITEPKTIND